MVKVGTCGFAGGRASCYRSFRVVEVQQTFYHPPSEETLRRWREEAPPGFEFTLKAFQAITHPATSPTYRRARLDIPPGSSGAYGLFRPTPEVWHGWEETRRSALALGARVVLFQCPPAFTPGEENIRNMQAFFRRIQGEGFVLAWEPRGRGWTEELVRSLCGELGLVHAVDPFVSPTVTPHLLYFRLHGGPRYSHQYTDAELATLARTCRGREGYVLFNNSRYMREDALRLLTLLGEG